MRCQHQRALNTLVNARRWRKQTIYCWIRLNNGALYASSNPMATSLFYDLHGNGLLRAWRQPYTVRLSIDRCRIWGLWMRLRSSEELGDVREADDAGGQTADERLHETLLRSPQKMPNSRRQLCKALDTLAHFRRWRTLTIYLGISLCDGRFGVVWILPPFCPNLESISCRCAPPSAGRLGASLCSLPLSSTPSSTINYKPMLAHSRTTTEQRSDMDALELGNDSGSLLACRNRLHSPQARGRLRGWTQPLGLDQQGLEAVLDSKEDSHRGRVRRELSRASLTRLLVFLTGSKSSLGFGRLGLETGA